jgi:hypothetical protein
VYYGRWRWLRTCVTTELDTETGCQAGASSILFHTDRAFWALVLIPQGQFVVQNITELYTELKLDLLIGNASGVLLYIYLRSLFLFSFLIPSFITFLSTDVRKEN